MKTLPTPHGDKLNALLKNEKLPERDRGRIEDALKKYYRWREDLMRVPEGDEGVAEAVRLLNEYRMFLDIDLVFDSKDDFLYRQKGQLKLESSVIEEFLPHLVSRAFPDAFTNFTLGPQSCFSAIYFTSTVRTSGETPGAAIRTKDQDFTIARQLYLAATFDPEYDTGVEHHQTSLGYLCAECKTNLDKTMFQEACATAHDVKTTVPGAKYFLLCEWLDMTPISTSGTDIDEVLILRKAKRISSQIRKEFATHEGRSKWREYYVQYLTDHPFSVDVFKRFLSHVKALLEDQEPAEEDALQRGYF